MQSDSRLYIYVVVQDYHQCGDFSFYCSAVNPVPAPEPIPVEAVYYHNGNFDQPWVGIAVILNTSGALVAENKVNMSMGATVFPNVPVNVLNVSVFFVNTLLWPPSVFLDQLTVQQAELNATINCEHCITNDSRIVSQLMYFPYGGSYELVTKIAYTFTNQTGTYGEIQLIPFNQTIIQVQDTSFLQTEKFSQVNQGLTIALVYLSSIEIGKFTYDRVAKAIKKN